MDSTSNFLYCLIRLKAERDQRIEIFFMIGWSSSRQPFFMMAQILSLEVIEGPAVHLKHTASVAYAESFRGGAKF